MPSYTLKDIPEALYDRIKASAERSRRSINAEILHRLERALTSTRLEPATFLERVRKRRESLDLPPVNDDEIRRARKEGRP